MSYSFHICFLERGRENKLERGRRCVSGFIGKRRDQLAGFFKQYELTYVIADERDVVRLRTNYRGEDVYLFRLHPPPEMLRNVFLDYLKQANRLKQKAEWYNALTENCTTSIRQHTMPYNPNHRFDWRMIVNGYIDEMLYERKRLDQSLPFSELKKRSYINERAKAVKDNEDFSRQIRVGLPGVTP